MPTYNTTVVAATGTSDISDLLAFSGDWMTAGHANTAFRIRDTVNNRYCYATILEVLSARLCRVQWDGEALPIGQNTVLWEEQALSTARGFPRCGCVYQGRLVFAGYRDAGTLLHMTKSGQFGSFDLGVAADADAIGVLVTGGVRAIQHVVDGPQLTIFTENGISYILVDRTKALTPTTVRFEKVSPHGVTNVRPGMFDGGVLMVTTGGAAVRDLAYSSEADNIQAEPVSLPATGYLNGIIDAAYLAGSNSAPEEMAFFVNGAGGMVVFHSIRSQKVGAWYEWTTLGTWTAVGVVAQQVFAVVSRLPGQYALEQFDSGLPFDACVPVSLASPGDAVSMSHVPAGTYGHLIDSAGEYLGTGVTGSASTFRTPSQQLEVPYAGTQTCTAGIAFDWWVDPLPPSVDLPDGTLLQRTQRLLRTSLRLRGAQSARNDGQSLVLRQATTGGLVTTPVTGWWSVRHLGWGKSGEDQPAMVPRITRDVPLSVTVLAMKREVKA